MCKLPSLRRINFWNSGDDQRLVGLRWFNQSYSSFLHALCVWYSNRGSKLCKWGERAILGLYKSRCQAQKTFLKRSLWVRQPVGIRKNIIGTVQMPASDVIQASQRLCLNILLYFGGWSKLGLQDRSLERNDVTEVHVFEFDILNKSQGLCQNWKSLKYCVDI